MAATKEAALARPMAATTEAALAAETTGPWENPPPVNVHTLKGSVSQYLYTQTTNLNHGQDTRANRTRHTTSSSTQSHAKQQHTEDLALPTTTSPVGGLRMHMEHARSCRYRRADHCSRSRSVDCYKKCSASVVRIATVHHEDAGAGHLQVRQRFVRETGRRQPDDALWRDRVSSLVAP